MKCKSYYKLQNKIYYYLKFTDDGLIRQEGYVIFPQKVITTEIKISATYDPFSHQIFVSTKDQIATFDSQGFKALTHLRQQIGDSPFETNRIEGNLLPINVVRFENELFYFPQ